MRDEFPSWVKSVLAARVGHRCSRPGCRALTSGPQLRSDKSLNIGVAAHLTAAAPQGPRYDSHLSPEERGAPANGIWLCQNCAKLIDNDPQRYAVEQLRTWKLEAEEYALRNIGRPEGLTSLERDARLRFRAAFMPALGELDAGKRDPFHVLAQSRLAHDAAILEYRHHIGSQLVVNYDDAVKRFRRIRDGTRPGILSFYQLQSSGVTTGARIEQVVGAIEQLLSFTES